MDFQDKISQKYGLKNMNFRFDDFLKIHNHSAMFYVEKLSHNYLDTYLCMPKNKENPYSIIINFPIIWHCDIRYKYIL